MVGALSFSGRLARRRNGRQNQRDQKTDNGNRNQQLDETEAESRSSRSTAARRLRRASGAARLAQLAALLADTPSAGESLTLGDCGYPITFAWLEALAPPMGLAIDWPEGVSAYRRRIEALPAVAAELADYMPKLRAFLARPVHDE